MAKRFSDTKIWDEDWFLELPNDYKLFWFYILATCDQAGFFKINTKVFCSINYTNIDVDLAFSYFNKGKKRLRKVNEGMWLIEDFFAFQYGEKFNLNNPMHIGIGKIFNKHGIDISEIKRVKTVSENRQNLKVV